MIHAVSVGACKATIVQVAHRLQSVVGSDRCNHIYIYIYGNHHIHHRNRDSVVLSGHVFWMHVHYDVLTYIPTTLFRVIVMSEGLLVEQGEPDALLQDKQGSCEHHVAV